MNTLKLVSAKLYFLYLMNSKTEFHQAPIVRVVPTTGLQELQEERVEPRESRGRGRGVRGGGARGGGVGSRGVERGGAVRWRGSRGGRGGGVGRETRTRGQ